MIRIGIINRSSPFKTSNGAESLDLAMVCGTFGQSVALFFVGEGVLQLSKHNVPEVAGRKNYGKSFAALEFYDVDDIYVSADDLATFGLEPHDLLVDATLLSPDEFRYQLAQQNKLLCF